MKVADKIYHRGTEINKINVWDNEDIFEAKGFDPLTICIDLGNGGDFIYVSNGFVCGMNQEETTIGEWHHYFVKTEDGFEAEKFTF
jgi:hypothetical protein